VAVDRQPNDGNFAVPRRISNDLDHDPRLAGALSC